MAVVRRIEKEKNQMKTEIEDLRAQIDHVTKAKVRVTTARGKARLTDRVVNKNER